MTAVWSYVASTFGFLASNDAAASNEPAASNGTAASNDAIHPDHPGAKKQKDIFHKEQAAYIKEKFHLVQNNAHPCEFLFMSFQHLTLYNFFVFTGLKQGTKNPCTKGNTCVFIGFPNDTCIYYIYGKCNSKDCRRVHYEEFRRRYEQYKQEFLAKPKDDTDAATQWLNENTRICPNCLLPVEKGPGCPQMHCVKCNNRFNWNDMETATGAKNQNTLKEVKKNIGKYVPQNLSDTSIQLFVVLMNGKSKHFIVELGSKVQDLMKRIEERTGIPIDTQRLQYGGKELRPNLTIKEYGFYNNSTIFLVQRLPGGF